MKKLLLPMLLYMVANGNASAGIGVSYDQATQNLNDYFNMEKTTLNDGRDRYLGVSSDEVALLEIIGNKDNISEASIMIGIPNDSPAIRARNEGLLLRFIENIIPEWANGSNWVISTIQKISNTDSDEIVINKGKKIITMHSQAALGIITRVTER